MFQQIFMLILCVFNAQRGQRCSLHTRTHFGEPLPIITKDEKLIEPNDKYGTINLDHGDILTLSCEGAGYITHPNAIQELTTASISCEGGDIFKNDDWLNAPSYFSNFRCDTPPDHFSRRTNRTCYEGNSVYEVGYRIQNRFYPLYESCFNQDSLNPLYSKYTQKPHNFNFQTRVDRPYFKADDVYNYLPVESLFSPRGLKGAVYQLVGRKIDDYINNKQELSRGHLAAKTDFVFAFGQRGTFHYVNCAPQWTGFNGGNWNTLEVDLRRRIHMAGYDTVIYTGTYGVTQLFNYYGSRVDLYLTTDENYNRVIPVPQYYYKVVYDPSSRLGTAFVGINNPYYSQEEAHDLFFCNDLCRHNMNFSWLTWHPDNPMEGYTFCCTVQDFRNTIRHLPQFEVIGLLS